MLEEPRITHLLARAKEGDGEARARLLEAVYTELHRLAAGYMRRERPDHTLQPSALVNEAYLRLLGGQEVGWESRSHFFVTAAQTMRRILIDHARKRAANKREGAARRVSLDPSIGGESHDWAQILDIDAALGRLAALDPRQARIVELRFFGGLTVEETAEVMAVSPKTVKRDWALARAWLEGELSPAGHDA